MKLLKLLFITHYNKYVKTSSFLLQFKILFCNYIDSFEKSHNVFNVQCWNLSTFLILGIYHLKTDWGYLPLQEWSLPKHSIHLHNLIKYFLPTVGWTCRSVERADLGDQLKRIAYHWAPAQSPTDFKNEVTETREDVWYSQGSTAG